MAADGRSLCPTPLLFILFTASDFHEMEFNAIMAFRQLGSLCWQEMTGFLRGEILFGVASLVGGAAKVSQNPGNKAGLAAYWLVAKPTFPDLPLQQALVSNSAPGTMAFCGVTNQNMNWACSHDLPCAQGINWRLSGNLS